MNGTVPSDSFFIEVDPQIDLRPGQLYRVKSSRYVVVDDLNSTDQVLDELLIETAVLLPGDVIMFIGPRRFDSTVVHFLHTAQVPGSYPKLCFTTAPDLRRIVEPLP